MHRKCSFPSRASPRLASSQAFAKIGVGCYRHFSGLAQLHDSSGPVKCNFSILQGRLGCNFDTASSRRTPFDHSEFGAGPKASRVSFLETIAEENDGDYTYVDVTRLPAAN